MIKTEGTGFDYDTKQGEFIKYFDRLRETGMGFDEIESKLPQLEKYYFEMVVKGVYYFNFRTLENLFINWKVNQ